MTPTKGVICGNTFSLLSVVYNIPTISYAEGLAYVKRAIHSPLLNLIRVVEADNLAAVAVIVDLKDYTLTLAVIVVVAYLIWGTIATAAEHLVYYIHYIAHVLLLVEAKLVVQNIATLVKQNDARVELAINPIAI